MTSRSMSSELCSEECFNRSQGPSPETTTASPLVGSLSWNPSGNPSSDSDAGMEEASAGVVLSGSNKRRRIVVSDSDSDDDDGDAALDTNNDNPRRPPRRGNTRGKRHAPLSPRFVPPSEPLSPLFVPDRAVAFARPDQRAIAAVARIQARISVLRGTVEKVRQTRPRTRPGSYLRHVLDLLDGVINDAADVACVLRRLFSQQRSEYVHRQ